MRERLACLKLPPGQGRVKGWEQARIGREGGVCVGGGGGWGRVWGSERGLDSVPTLLITVSLETERGLPLARGNSLGPVAERQKRRRQIRNSRIKTTKSLHPPLSCVYLPRIRGHLFRLKPHSLGFLPTSAQSLTSVLPNPPFRSSSSVPSSPAVFVHDGVPSPRLQPPPLPPTYSLFKLLSASRLKLRVPLSCVSC